MKSSIRKTILAIVFCCVWGGMSAQDITIFFPKFVGRDYVFVLNQGLKVDTVQSGTIGETGIVNLTVPEKYKGYMGIGSWSIVNSGGVNFIVNDDDFSITCKDSVPNPSNTFYKGSKENDLMNKYEAELFVFYQRMDSLFRAENITEHRDSFPPSFLKGMAVLNKDYIVIQQRLAADPSYAAFFWRTFNFIRGLGNRIYFKPGDEKDYFQDLTNYIVGELDFTRLFFSGLWNPIITASFNAVEDKHVWAENMVSVLKRTESQRVFEALSIDLIIISEQFGWEDAEKVILAYLESSGRLPDDPGNLVNRAILQSKVRIGDKAPALKGIEGTLTNALIIFYESSCPHCQHQLDELTQYYPQFVEKGIRVISVSTDENKEVFEYHSKNFPWPDRLCDFKGFRSENLINFGVVGTPTIYFIDENGIIKDRQARLEDIKGLILK